MIGLSAKGQVSTSNNKGWRLPWELQITSYHYILFRIPQLICSDHKGNQRFQIENNGIKLESSDFTNKNTWQLVKVNNKYLETDLHVKIFIASLKFKFNWVSYISCFSGKKDKVLKSSESLCMKMD